MSTEYPVNCVAGLCTTDIHRACAGKQIMNLWDHLCTILRARVVSTEDVSSKVRAFHSFPHHALSKAVDTLKTV